MIDILKEKHQIEVLLLERNDNISFNGLLQKPSFNKQIMVDIDDVKDIISGDDWSDGVYGFLNYQLDLNYNKLLERGYTLNKKSINLEDAIRQNYGVLELFIKTNHDIKNVNKYHLIKDGNINIINNTNYKIINVDELEDDFIITKIYKIEPKKIIHITNMTKNEYIIEDDTNKQFIDYHNKMVGLYGNNKKMLDYVFNFDSIYKLKNIIKMDINIYNPDDIMDFNFKNIICNVKISNRYSVNEYNDLINKFYGQNYDDIFQTIIKTYKINNNIKDAFKIVLEILMRLYIDHFAYGTSYCLNKNLITYIPLEDDPYLQSKETMVRRYCKKILLSGKIDDIIILIFQKLKTHNMVHIINYIDDILKN